MNMSIVCGIFIGAFLGILILFFLGMLPTIGMYKQSQRDVRDLNNEVNRLHVYYKEELANKCRVKAWYVHEHPIEVLPMTLTETDRNGNFTVRMTGRNGVSGLKLYDKASDVPQEYKEDRWKQKALFSTPEEAYIYAMELAELRITTIREQEEPWIEKMKALEIEMKALRTPE